MDPPLQNKKGGSGWTSTVASLPPRRRLREESVRGQGERNSDGVGGHEPSFPAEKQAKRSKAVFSSRYGTDEATHSPNPTTNPIPETINQYVLSIIIAQYYQSKPRRIRPGNPYHFYPFPRSRRRRRRDWGGRRRMDG